MSMMPASPRRAARRVTAIAFTALALLIAGCSSAAPSATGAPSPSSPVASTPKGDPSFNTHPGVGVGGTIPYFFTVSGEQETLNMTLASLAKDVTATDTPPAAGQKFVAVEMTFANQAPPGAAVTLDLAKTVSYLTADGQPTAMITTGTFPAATPRLPGTLTLDGGQSVTGWFVFSMAADDRPLSLRIAPTADLETTWSLLPPAPASATP